MRHGTSFQGNDQSPGRGNQGRYAALKGLILAIRLSSLSIPKIDRLLGVEPELRGVTKSRESRNAIR
jgi:hypothetical protein